MHGSSWPPTPLREGLPVSALTVRQVRRWSPPARRSALAAHGADDPIDVLLLLQRGLTLSQVGLALAAQGVVVMMLELPTGGLADAVGRRRVLLTAMVFGIASTGLFLVADSFPMFSAAWALQGVYRALDSGPLEAWYVDATRPPTRRPSTSVASARGHRRRRRDRRGALPAVWRARRRAGTRPRCPCWRPPARWRRQLVELVVPLVEERPATPVRGAAAR